MVVTLALALHRVDAAGGLDDRHALPRQLRSSSDDARPAVGLDAQAASTRPAGGLNPMATVGGARTRVRLGPYATREEADKAAGRVKAAGLPASVLAL